MAEKVAIPSFMREDLVELDDDIVDENGMIRISNLSGSGGIAYLPDVNRAYADLLASEVNTNNTAPLRVMKTDPRTGISRSEEVKLPKVRRLERSYDYEMIAAPVPTDE